MFWNSWLRIDCRNMRVHRPRLLPFAMSSARGVVVVVDLARGAAALARLFLQLPDCAWPCLCASCLYTLGFGLPYPPALRSCGRSCP